MQVLHVAKLKESHVEIDCGFPILVYWCVCVWLLNSSRNEVREHKCLPTPMDAETVYSLCGK